MLRKQMINLRPVHCPHCGQRMPLLRLPASLRQFLFGGWICSKCRVQLDKWGNEPTRG